MLKRKTPSLSLEAEISSSGLGFRLSGELLQHISTWETAIDREVFEEQLRTGQFRGRDLDSDLLTIMRHAKNEGRIMPYYGAGGSRGVLVYHFSPAQDQCRVQATHEATNGQLEWVATFDSKAAVLSQGRPTHLKFSILPYLLPANKLPDAWKPGRDPEIVYHITGQSWEILRTWEHWNEQEAFAGRYRYEFGTVSLGPGFAAQVEDVLQSATIDVSDYDSW
jgi:hypothetical protein